MPAIERYTFVLERLVPYLATVRKERLVQQKVATLLGLDPDQSDPLLTLAPASVLDDPTAGEATDLLGVLLTRGFIDAEILETAGDHPAAFAALTLLNKIATLFSKLQVGIEEQTWLLSVGVPAGMLDPAELPLEPPRPGRRSTPSGAPCERPSACATCCREAPPRPSRSSRRRATRPPPGRTCSGSCGTAPAGRSRKRRRVQRLAMASGRVRLRPGGVPRRHGSARARRLLRRAAQGGRDGAGGRRVGRGRRDARRGRRHRPGGQGRLRAEPLVPGGAATAKQAARGPACGIGLLARAPHTRGFGPQRSLRRRPASTSRWIRSCSPRASSRPSARCNSTCSAASSTSSRRTSAPVQKSAGRGCATTACGRRTGGSSSTRRPISSRRSATTSPRSSRGWRRSCCRRRSPTPPRSRPI